MPPEVGPFRHDFEGGLGRTWVDPVREMRGNIRTLGKVRTLDGIMSAIGVEFCWEDDGLERIGTGLHFCPTDAEALNHIRSKGRAEAMVEDILGEFDDIRGKKLEDYL